MRTMESTQHKPYWTTFDKRDIDISDLTDQHLSNIYWFSRVFYKGVHQDIEKEIIKRFGKLLPLSWKPLPVPNEILELRNLGLIKGDEIIFEGSVIGSISHIK